MPQDYPGNVDALREELWGFFMESLAPGDDYTLIDAVSAEQVARITIPDDPRYENVNWRARRFGQDNARIGAHLDALSATSGAASIDLPRLLRQVAALRLDPEAEIDLLVIGDPVYVSEAEPHFSMRGPAGGILVPSDSHIPAPVAETPFGTAGRAGDLAGVTVHFCHTGQSLASDADAAVHRFWSLVVEGLGGELVTWTGDLAGCFDRFSARARNAPAAFTLAAEGPLAMTRIARDEVASGGGGTVINGIAVDSFNLFASNPHPALRHVQVTTGVEYEPASYPERYTHAWCYFSVMRDGIRVRFSVGAKEYGRPVTWRSATPQSLAAGGITVEEFVAAESACQWPEG